MRLGWEVTGLSEHARTHGVSEHARTHARPLPLGLPCNGQDALAYTAKLKHQRKPSSITTDKLSFWSPSLLIREKKDGALHGEALEGHRADGAGIARALLAVGGPTVGSLRPCSSAKGRRREPWHLSTHGGQPLPGEHRFHLHEAAQLPRACWDQQIPICVVSGAGEGGSARRTSIPPLPAATPTSLGSWRPAGVTTRLPRSDARCWPCPSPGSLRPLSYRVSTLWISCLLPFTFFDMFL